MVGGYVCGSWVGRWVTCRPRADNDRDNHDDEDDDDDADADYDDGDDGHQMTGNNISRIRAHTSNRPGGPQDAPSLRRS